MFGDKQVDTGAELDKSHFLILLYLLTHTGIANYAAGHSASNLANHDFLTIGEQKTHRGTLVEDAGLGIGSNKIVILEVRI